LHEIRFTMATADWAALKQDYKEDTYYNVTGMVWKGAGSLTASVNNFQIRSRGNGSRSPVKPGIHVDFTKLVSTQRFLGLQEFELKSNSQDGSLMHEFITFDLMRRVGVIVGRIAETRLYVNNEYIG